MEEFADWVASEIQQRGWSVPEVSRRSKRGGYKGISASMIYMVINRQANPGQQFYEGIARAFDMHLRDVMIQAGEWPDVASAEDDKYLEQVLWLWSFVPNHKKETIMEMIRGVAVLAPESDQETERERERERE